MMPTKLIMPRNILAAIVTFAIASLAALSFSACKNPLAAEAKAIRAEAASPRMSLSDDKLKAVGANGTITFPGTSLSGNCDLLLTIGNSGKTALAIDATNISITMGSGTAAGTFSLKTPPHASIQAGASDTFELRFSPTALGTSSATVVIPTNDIDHPLFTFTVQGAGVSNAKEMIAFSLISSVANHLDQTVDGIISGLNIAVTVPYGTNPNGLIASYSATGSSVTVAGNIQVSGTTGNDFRTPVSYLVTASDGTAQTYVVTVTVALNSAKDITAFSFPSLSATGTITDGAIALNVPYGSDLSNLIATFTTTGASVAVGTTNVTSNQSPGVDFSKTKSVTYTVTADDGSSKDYVVTLTVQKNSAKDITAFGISGYTNPATITATTISVTLPFGSDPTQIYPTFTLSDWASVSVGSAVQTSGSLQSAFPGTLSYVVTAQDGTQKTYAVTIAIAKNPAKDITAFGFATPAATGSISGTTITVTLPSTTSATTLTSLAATFTAPATATVTVGGVTQTSGITTNNFSSSQSYLVTAADGTMQTYTVTVAIASDTAKELTTFGFATPQVSVPVTGSSITVNVPHGTNLGLPMVAYFTTTGASVKVGVTPQVSGVTANNFSSPLTYVVTAGNGDTSTYTVTVNVVNTIPTLSTQTVGAISPTTATCGGIITDDGGAAITAYGVCWSTNSPPTTADSVTNDGSGIADFTNNSSLVGLTAGTRYYVRAYATNSVGTAYGSTMVFTTLTVPTVVTGAIGAITTTSVACGGDVKATGGTPITAHGVCWATSTGPIATGSHTNEGTDTGIFSSSITGIAAGTRYYVRAYATNSVGTAYGAEVSFLLPTLSFDANDPNASSFPVTGTMAAQAIPTASQATLATLGFAKLGYTFLGWATSSTGSKAFDGGASYTMGAANATLYAKWSLNPPKWDTVSYWDIQLWAP